MQRRAFVSVRSYPFVRLRQEAGEAEAGGGETRGDGGDDRVGRTTTRRFPFSAPRGPTQPTRVDSRRNASTSDPAYAPIGTPHTPVDSSTPGFATPSLFSRSLDFRLTDGAALILRQPRREAVDVKHVSARGEAPHGFLRLEFHATHRALFLLLILALLRDVRSHGKGVHDFARESRIACRSVRRSAVSSSSSWRRDRDPRRLRHPREPRHGEHAIAPRALFLFHQLTRERRDSSSSGSDAGVPSWVPSRRWISSAPADAGGVRHMCVVEGIAGGARRGRRPGTA